MHDALIGDRQEQSYNDSEMGTEGVEVSNTFKISMTKTSGGTSNFD
jgi:formaldehyde-activating enzyme involved in methanogenesis